MYDSMQWWSVVLAVALPLIPLPLRTSHYSRRYTAMHPTVSLPSE